MDFPLGSRSCNRITGVQREGYVAVLEGFASFGGNNQTDFNALENWLCTHYEKVTLVGHTVSLEYETPVTIHANY